MNGEIDIISQVSILPTSSICASGHPGLTVSLPTSESAGFVSVNDCIDLDCSKNSESNGGGSGRGRSREPPKLCEDLRTISVEKTCCALPSLKSQEASNSLYFTTDFVSEHPQMIEANISAGFDGVSTTRFSKPNCYHADILDRKTTYGVVRMDELKPTTSSDDATAFGMESIFSHPSKPAPSTTGDVSFDVNPPSISNATLCLDSRIMRQDQENSSFISNPSKSKQSTVSLFSVGENDVSSEEREHGVASTALWNKPVSDDSSVFTYPNDSLPHLLPSGLGDQPVSGCDSGQNNGSPFSTAKRPITGGHQNSRFGAARPNTWANSTFNGSQLSQSSNSGSWNLGNNYANKLSPFSPANPPTVSGLSPNSTSPTPWTNVLMSQPTQVKTTNLANMLNNMNLEGSASSGTSNSRTTLSINSLTSGLSPVGINKNSNGNGLTNIYSMFPKRPQHRMMAHWQQQQQHHHPGVQPNQLIKTPTSLQSNIMQQLSLNRLTGSGSDVNAAAGDTTNLMSFKGGCSVLHSLTSTSSNSASTPLSIGSSGDSFVPLTPVHTSGSDLSSPLDNFKFGLDQQLMEVIKAFGSNGVNTGPSSSVDTNNNSDNPVILNGVDEVVLPPFSEIDQQFSNLVAVNHLSMLGQSACSSSAPSLSGMGCTNNHASSLRSISGAPMLGPVGLPSPYSVFTSIPSREEGYSRKVFVGGLPPDIDEEEITTAFRRFGPLIVDWPHKTESKAYFPPKGYCFLLFQDERSVQSLINACIVDEGKYYWCVSSPTMKDKPVQIRPWNLADSDFVMDGSQPLDPRKTIFVGGVPRPLRAIELALIMDRLYSGVCYAGIDTDPELKYPKGAGRVAFSNQQSYIAAISARFVQLQHNEIDKRVEVKPYVLDNQMCDECQGARCGGKFAPFFCANVACLQYYCEQCWVQIHSRNGREYHKPLVKEGAERPRPALYRW